MPDGKKLHPPQWLGRPIVSGDHLQDLETRAAINEFHHKMPRHEAEQRAHDDYVKEQRERAAAHHLAGMKAAMATGNHEDARKHWAMYDLHLKGLGKESIGAVPPEVESRMSEDGDKPVYKFKAHKGDLYALHEPSKDVAPPQGQPIQKAEIQVPDSHKIGMKVPMGGSSCASCKYVSEDGKSCGNKLFQDWNGGPTLPAPADQYCCDYYEPQGELAKAEARQCKWRLGERRCQRMVKGDYCHDHVDHWANKIKQKQDEEPMEKSAAETAVQLLKAVAELAKGKLLQFSGNPAPAVDQGQPAPIAGAIGSKSAVKYTPAIPGPGEFPAGTKATEIPRPQTSALDSAAGADYTHVLRRHGLHKEGHQLTVERNPGTNGTTEYTAKLWHPGAEDHKDYGAIGYYRVHPGGRAEYGGFGDAWDPADPSGWEHFEPAVKEALEHAASTRK